MVVCSWHVMRSWLKALNSKVDDADRRIEMFDRLLEIMRYDAALGTLEQVKARVMEMVEEFERDFADEEDFLAYFRSTWIDGAVNSIGGLPCRESFCYPCIGPSSGAARAPDRSSVFQCNLLWRLSPCQWAPHTVL